VCVCIASSIVAYPVGYCGARIDRRVSGQKKVQATTAISELSIALQDSILQCTVVPIRNSIIVTISSLAVPPVHITIVISATSSLSSKPIVPGRANMMTIFQDLEYCSTSGSDQAKNHDDSRNFLDEPVVENPCSIKHPTIHYLLGAVGGGEFPWTERSTEPRPAWELGLGIF
jgi:hypothetical protein